MEKEGIFALPGSLQLVLDEFKESDSMKKCIWRTCI